MFKVGQRSRLAGSWPAGRENPRGNFSGAGPFLWMGLLFFFLHRYPTSPDDRSGVGVRRGPSPSSSCNNPPDIGIDLAFLAFPLALRCAAVRRGRSTWSRPRHLEMVTPLELRRGGCRRIVSRLADHSWIFLGLPE